MDMILLRVIFLDDSHGPILMLIYIGYLKTYIDFSSSQIYICLIPRSAYYCISSTERLSYSIICTAKGTIRLSTPAPHLIHII